MLIAESLNLLPDDECCSAPRCMFPAPTFCWHKLLGGNSVVNIHEGDWSWRIFYFRGWRFYFYFSRCFKFPCRCVCLRLRLLKKLTKRFDRFFPSLNFLSVCFKSHDNQFYANILKSHQSFQASLPPTRQEIDFKFHAHHSRKLKINYHQHSAASEGCQWLGHLKKGGFSCFPSISQNRSLKRDSPCVAWHKTHSLSEGTARKIDFHSTAWRHRRQQCTARKGGERKMSRIEEFWKNVTDTLSSPVPSVCCASVCCLCRGNKRNKMGKLWKARKNFTLLINIMRLLVLVWKLRANVLVTSRKMLGKNSEFSITFARWVSCVLEFSRFFVLRGSEIFSISSKVWTFGRRRAD